MKAALRILVLCAAACWSGAGVTRATQPSGLPVLMYHRVDALIPTDAVGRDLTVAPPAFDAQLRWLRAHGIATITAADLARALDAGKLPAHAVVLTFDDGYDDAATTALPILARYHDRATFYVSSGFVGTPRHLSWAQMRALRAAGMDVACHGTFHLDLSTLDRAGQLAESAGCLRRFARYLGNPKPVTYAYPAGKSDAVTLEIMRSLGMRLAFSERPGLVELVTPRYDEPRRRIRHDDSVTEFGSLATP